LGVELSQMSNNIPKSTAALLASVAIFGTALAQPMPLPYPEGGTRNETRGENRTETRSETNQSWNRTNVNVNINVNSPMPGVVGSDSIEAGQDQDGKIVYPVVAYINGIWTPGKTKAPFTNAWVGFGGTEKEVPRFQMVTGRGLSWAPMNGFNLPANAVAVGPDQDGTQLYIARGNYMGRWVAGKYRAGARYALVPFGGRERECMSFEILVQDPQARLKPAE
jgi:hypothetical protein